MHNNIKIIIGILIILVISGLVFFKNDIWGKTTILGTSTNSHKENRFCYITKTQSDLGENFEDIKYFEFTQKDTIEIRGKINYLSAEKDSIIGDFIGVIEKGYMNIIYSATRKDNQWKEQKIFRVYEDLIIESDNSDKKDINGTLMFNDISKVVFGNDGIFSQISCSEINKKEVGLE